MGGDGIVFLHTGTGKLFTSNAVGARIWRGLADQASLQSIAAGISSELGVPQQQVEQDAESLLPRSRARGLVSGMISGYRRARLAAQTGWELLRYDGLYALRGFRGSTRVVRVRFRRAEIRN